MAHEAFISHSTKDKRVADAVVAHLERAGIRCWVAPRDIAPGSSWAASILQAISDCQVMVFIFSSHANTSDHVHREIERAIHHGKTVIPFRIEAVLPQGELEYFLSSSHWMDAITPPVERHCVELAAKLRILLALPQASVTAAVQPQAQQSAPVPVPERQPQRSSMPQSLPVSKPAPTSRRSFLWGMTATGATVCGIYALNLYQQAKGREAHADGSKPNDTKPHQGGNQAGVSGGATTKPTPPDGAEMVWLPAGTFQMGGNGEYDGKPIHTVTLSGFWMYKTPVTVAQFRKYCDSGRYRTDFGKDYDWNGNKQSWGWLDNHPMVNVSWEEASAYTKWAGVLLLTESQWEYAARGGLDGKNYPWGDAWDGSKCANSVKPNYLKGTKPVGSYPANGYDLYDMAGNVWQWCADRYDKDYYKAGAANGPNPAGPASGSYRVLRGGSWGNSAENYFRCAYRYYLNPKYMNGYHGFRCCAPRS